MYFSRLSVTNFGPFEQAYVAFRPAGLSVIVGGNGSGKTQLAGAIVAAVVGKPALRIDEGGSGPSTVELVMGEGEHSEDLRLAVFRDTSGEVVVLESSDGTGAGKPRGELALRLMGAWSDPSGPRLLLDSEAFRRQESAVDVDALDSLLPDELKRCHEWRRLRASAPRANVK